MQRVAPPEKVSLLKKYDIPLDHLSYEYVEKCSNKKELERILRILRSAEEGYFPDLIKHTEDKLRQVYPKSHVLRVEAPILTKDSLTNQERKILEDDLLSWETEMKFMDQTLEAEKQQLQGEIPKNLPEIRKVVPAPPKKVSKK